MLKALLRLFKAAPDPDVTQDVYSRWLRACRPPLSWFLRLSDMEQEHLAVIGEEYTQDTVIAIGYAVADPSTAEASVGAAEGDLDSEETLVRQLATGVAQHLLQGKPPTTRPKESFANFGKRRNASHAVEGKPKPSLWNQPAEAP